VSYHIRDATKVLSDTPRTDAAYFKPHSTMYDLAGEMKRIERELTASNERVRLLISERDTARGYADQKWKLRQEFHDLFGTDDIAEAVALVFGLKDRIKRLEAAGDAMAKDFSHFWTDRNSVRDWPKAKEAKP
jgi:hypothetical protein